MGKNEITLANGATIKLVGSDELTDLHCGAGAFETGDDDPLYTSKVCPTHDLDCIEGGSKEDLEYADENFKKNCEFEYHTKGALGFGGSITYSRP